MAECLSTNLFCSYLRLQILLHVIVTHSCDLVSTRVFICLQLVEARFRLAITIMSITRLQPASSKVKVNS